MFVPLFLAEKVDPKDREIYFIRGWAVASINSGEKLVFTGNPCDTVFGFMVEESDINGGAALKLPIIAEEASTFRKTAAVLLLKFSPPSGGSVDLTGCDRCGEIEIILEKILDKELDKNVERKKLDSLYSNNIKNKFGDIWDQVKFLEETWVTMQGRASSPGSPQGGGGGSP